MQRTQVKKLEEPPLEHYVMLVEGRAKAADSAWLQLCLTHLSCHPCGADFLEDAQLQEDDDIPYETFLTWFKKDVRRVAVVDSDAKVRAATVCTQNHTHTGS